MYLKKKIFAAFFLLVFSIQTFYPGAAYALTSGPSQPEMQKFQPAGLNDMVDLFSGDFKYNIPLMDVGGYPVNLAYNGNCGAEDEATWVGSGWTLNPGAVNRNLRGLPDDFKGDKIEKTYSRKEFKKVGGEVTLALSLFAKDKGSAGIKVGVYKDNYYGIGASVGADVSFKLAKNSATPLTVGLGVSSDTRSGVDISPSFSLSTSLGNIGDLNAGGALSGSFQYNTRAGLKQTELGVSCSAGLSNDYIPTPDPITASASSTHYFGQSYTPSIANNESNTGYTFGFDLGGTAFAIFGGVGGTGYVYKQKILEKVKSIGAYGYMNYLEGRSTPNVLLDFNREKDGVFIKSNPSIATPVATQDFFSASGQTGSQQFRPYFSGNYVVSDPMHTNTNSNSSFGVTIGAIHTFKAGARVNLTNGKAISKKWTNGNEYLTVGEAAFNNSNPVEEPVYFKQVGEHTMVDNDFLDKVNTDHTTTVAIQQAGSNAKALAVFKQRETPTSAAIPNPIKRNKRDIRNFGFSFLNAQQAAKYGLDKTINSYTYSSTGVAIAGESRETTDRKAHHISEIKVTDNEGKRMVYGIPVYNITQEELTFSVEHPATAGLDEIRRKGQIGYSVQSNNDPTYEHGRDELFTKEKTPGYATSFLLTGILSPDYVDVKNDGITDDDLGTAVKFNYNKVSESYKWRAPYSTDEHYPKANFNEGLLSDTKDDKANYTYGEKELWYLKAIESKTMIAIFETSNREDGLGVNSKIGGKNTSVRVQKLDRIKLYSKAEWIAKGPVNAEPIKVVHFEYDYSLNAGIPNNTGTPVNKLGTALSSSSDPLNVNKGGKLTLKKVYFTFGSSSRGESNPYEFDYDMRLINNATVGTGGIANLPLSTDADELADNYVQKQQDRWGTYKQSWFNHQVNSGTSRVFNNAEFPYSIQKNDNTLFDERLLADRFASKWQLNKITTPAGGIIDIQYESDDYAYVQDRRAMQMCFVKGIHVLNQTDGLINADEIVVELPFNVSTDADFKERYLDGIDKLYYNFLVNLDGNGHTEYVQGYAEIDKGASVRLSNSTAKIVLKKVDGYNPIAKAAWQKLQTELPQFAYDNYDNTEVSNDAVAAIKSIISAIGNLRELLESFDSKASRKGFANKATIGKSFVRLDNPDYKKIGGGHRVKKITMEDTWQAMTGISDYKTAKYGLEYDYTTKNDIGDIISSGVASYEPSIGNDENPFHEPISYTEKVQWSKDKYHYIEKPYCEGYFPAAQVGYSKVKVTNTGVDDAKQTGYSESEFYTAKDFPTIVDNTTLEQQAYEPSITLSLFSSVSRKRMATSQGFKVELNDMHGKPKTTKTFNQGGDVLSSTEYFYSLENENALTKKLNNNVPVLSQEDFKTVQTKQLATEVDLVTDVRESSNETLGVHVGAKGGMFLFPPWPIIIPPFIFIPPFPIPYVFVNGSTSITSDYYNSISSVKVVNRFGLLKKVRATQNGSTITTENLVWDGVTGEVLLTSVQNQFDDKTYAFNYPAYMVQDYQGMAGAYKNMGAIFTGLSTNSSGEFPSGNTYDQYLFPGDELIGLSIDHPLHDKAWIIKDYNGNLRLIDYNGNYMAVSGTYMVARSGRRNMLTAGAGSIISMKNPIVAGELNFSVDTKILDAKSVTYKDLWGIPAVIYHQNREVMAHEEPHGGVYYTIAAESYSCDDAGSPINPYNIGVLGNWRAETNNVYTVNRVQIPGLPTQQGGTDIRRSGYYGEFTPFWQPSATAGNGFIPNATVDNRWVWTNKPVYFDRKGNEIENVDALNRFGSALFGYQGSVATAVAANARHNEIMFDGFEDYDFSLATASCDLEKKRQFEWGIDAPYSPVALEPTMAHTGKHSLKLNAALDLTGIDFGRNLPPFAPFDMSGSPVAESSPSISGRFQLNHNEPYKGFGPVEFEPAGSSMPKKYLLSLWVNDGAPESNKIQNLDVSVNGVSFDAATTIVPVVEGWKRLDLEFTSNGQSSFSLSLHPTGSVYIDDVRMLPFSAQMNSYVYDDRSMRLTAQLDENNFATLYEYDEEGTLVRVKKETERGIMTLKENRKFLRNKRP